MKAEAIAREDELFPNLARERRGVDDAPCADDEEDTAVGAPIEQPADLA